MDLFTYAENNILPLDGELYYYPSFISQLKCDFYFDELLNNIPWQHDEVMMFGKKINTKRKVAWYGDEGCSYVYSKILRLPISWNELLLGIKTQVEEKTNTHFNSCLLNLYQDGSESMAYHADDEPMLEKNGTIASISFGAERRFLFRHNHYQENKIPIIETLLSNGSLLLMQGAIQQHWKHALPVSKKIKTPRINLTFRNIVTVSR
ncbi:MAG: alpha-ketoglutarate-dependent dioxygenase AlkB family protein [Bacteroidota bacterium]